MSYYRDYWREAEGSPIEPKNLYDGHRHLISHRGDNASAAHHLWMAGGDRRLEHSILGELAWSSCSRRPRILRLQAIQIVVHLSRRTGFGAHLVIICAIGQRFFCWVDGPQADPTPRVCNICRRGLLDSPLERTDLPPMIKKKSGATTPRHAVVVQLPRVQGLAPCSLHQGHLRRLRRCRRIRVGILDCRCARPLRQEAGRGEGMVVFDRTKG